MSYSKFGPPVRYTVMVAQAASLGTTTAANTAAIARADLLKFPTFVRRTAVTGITVVCTTIPNAASTAVYLDLLQGTNTIASVLVTTNTASQATVGTITGTTLNTFTAGQAGPTLNEKGTATASGSALGAYSIWLECEELNS